MKILFSTGEISGENYAIKLKENIAHKVSNIDFIGIGSSRLEDHGIRIIGDISSYSTVGITDIVKSFPSLYSLYEKLKKSIKTEKPDLIIYIDSPGLNLRLIPYIKKMKIKSAYIFPPQVWAWRKKRIEKLRLVNKIIVGLPFEEVFYRDNGLKAKFLGHPLIDIVKVDEEYKETIRQKFDEGARFIGVFPGSRVVEIKNHLPILGQTLEKISKKFSDTVYLIASPNIEFQHFLEEGLEEYDFLYEIINAHPYEIMDLSEFILTASGTTTLEAAIVGVPEIIFYRMNLLNWLMAKFLVKVDFIGLPNLIYGKLVIPELVQWDFNPYSLEYLIIKFLVDPKLTSRISDKLTGVKDLLGQEGVIDRIGDEIISMIS